MTDPQTPATEAGRRLLAKEDADVPYGGASVDDILAIEAEARADALREATDAVRQLERQWDGDEDTVKVGDVLAILDPQQ